MSPCAVATSSAVVRVTSSVPSTPTAVVTPARREGAELERGHAGVRAGLAAAPGEVRVTVDEPGTRRRPPRSVSSGSSSEGRAGRPSPIQTMRLAGDHADPEVRAAPGA